MTLRYLEDFTAGDRFLSPTAALDDEQIIVFGKQFDPQPFHTGHDSAEGTFFGGLAASGWHTAALTMRLLVQSDLGIAIGIIGRGVESLTWPRAVRPGDVLQVESEVLEVTRSASKPDRGNLRLRSTTRNQKSEVVQVMTSNLVVPARTVP